VIFLIFTTYLLVFHKDFFIGLNLTLTGRIFVWQVSFETWLKNPIFGYGPNFWDTHFRQDYGYLWAGQAHNQFLQTLGESGILGFGGLLFFFITIIRVGSRSANNTNFASYGIIVALIIRSFFESPLSTYSLDQSFLVLALFWIILINSQQDFMFSKKITSLSN
jgi:exopolysaccharide production protein ExoQ